MTKQPVPGVHENFAARTPPPESHLMGLDEATKQKLREALRFSASRSVMSAEDERRILSALETPPVQHLSGLTDLETELLSALKLFRDTIIGEVHDKWDEGVRAGKLIVALANPTLKYRADISGIHAAIAKADAVRAATTEGSDNG